MRITRRCHIREWQFILRKKKINQVNSFSLYSQTATKNVYNNFFCTIASHMLTQSVCLYASRAIWTLKSDWKLRKKTCCTHCTDERIICRISTTRDGDGHKPKFFKCITKTQKWTWNCVFHLLPYVYFIKFERTLKVFLLFCFLHWDSYLKKIKLGSTYEKVHS